LFDAVSEAAPTVAARALASPAVDSFYGYLRVIWLDMVGGWRRGTV
jgi:hypothetical protein